MIKFNNQTCYSPLPPTEYARKLQGETVGPCSLAVKIATGEITESHPEVTTGLHFWNLVWLLTPTVDTLPAAYSSKDADKVRHAEKEARRYSIDEMTEILDFADGCSSWLLDAPTKFLTRVKNLKWKLPCGVDFNMAMERAMLAEGRASLFEAPEDVPAVTAGNVIKVTHTTWVMTYPTP